MWRPALDLTLPCPPDTAAPEPVNGDGAAPVPGWTRRLWWRLKRGLAASQGHSGQAPLTAREEVFALQLARLRGQLQDKETEIFRLKTELEFAKAEILVKGKQLELMAEVHELDRARVAADQAVYSAVQAEYEARRQGRGAGQ